MDKHPGGRPPKYESAEEMQLAIDEYFTDCAAQDRPPTISGLGLALGMTTETLRKYSEKDKFSATVKEAKQRVEDSLEAGMLKGYNATGAIFNLKNNFGWKDKSEIDQNHSLTVNVNR